MMLLLELILGLVIVGAIIFIIVSLRSRRKGTLDSEYYQNEWGKLLKLIPQGEQGWRLAIIDADKLLGQALKQHGTKGESMSDRLREREKHLSHYNNLLSAHKLRNRLVHEPNVTLTKQLTTRALKEFQVALKELGALR